MTQISPPLLHAIHCPSGDHVGLELTAKSWVSLCSAWPVVSTTKMSSRLELSGQYGKYLVWIRRVPSGDQSGSLQLSMPDGASKRRLPSRDTIAMRPVPEVSKL